jgi:hypothetical protein
MDRMPEPGDLIPYSFTAMPGRCCRLIYSPQLQATHCYQAPAWKGIGTKGKSWYVEACTEHAPKIPLIKESSGSSWCRLVGWPDW